MPREEFIRMAVDELVHIGIVNRDDVVDATMEKLKKAYPSYVGSYFELDKVREFLDGIGNLYCIGRNGQHRYNNMDHSMLTAMAAVKGIKEGNDDKSEIWNINTEEEYHESK
jgi:protoporphyrinogen oxidase